MLRICLDVHQCEFQNTKSLFIVFFGGLMIDDITLLSYPNFNFSMK